MSYIDQIVPPTEARLLWVESEAADYLRVSPRTLQRHRQQGTGPKFIKAGRRVLYSKPDIDSWLDANCAASTAQAQGGAR